MDSISHGRRVAFALLLAALVVPLGAAALVVPAPASAGPPPTGPATAPSASPCASADELLVLLAVQQARLTAVDGAAGDEFGWSVAISGDTAVVGAPYDDIGANADQGSAYVFVRSGVTWGQQQKLSAADGAADDFFGCSVAIAGDSAVVGACGDDVGANANQGSAYVFVRSGVTWGQQAKLTAADGAANDTFGCSVAIAGETAVVGAPNDDVGATANQGSAYVFVRSGVTWTQQQKLVAGDGAVYDNFGSSVAIAGETAVMGAPNHDVGAHSAQGSAYAFVRSGTTWSEQTQLVAADGATDDWFGYSVALSGDTAVVGAYWDNVGARTAQGSAYVFLPAEVAAPGRPTAKSPKGLISSRTPTFKWTAAAGAASYEVRIYKGSTLIKKKTGITKLSWKCTKRLPRGVYLTWKVRAHNAAGWGPWSAKPRFKVR